MKRKLDLENWNRKEHFQFFKEFEEPFFGVTVEIDCTKAYQYCKQAGHSFFLYYLHKTLVAVNSIESFRYRIIDDEVMVFDEVHASATISRPDGTFGFSYIVYSEVFSEFVTACNLEIKRIRNSKGLHPAAAGENVIHFSSVPWLKFTSLSHARRFSFNDSCPKISVGKMTENDGKKVMPVSVHVHHALVDGYHLGMFMEAFQQLMDGES